MVRAWSVELYGPICGTPTYDRSEVPGLMRGVAGTGYALLRRVNPSIAPCLLLLQPPSQSRLFRDESGIDCETCAGSRRL